MMEKLYRISGNRIDADDEKLEQLIADGVLNELPDEPLYRIDPLVDVMATICCGVGAVTMRAVLGFPSTSKVHVSAFM